MTRDEVIAQTLARVAEQMQGMSGEQLYKAFVSPATPTTGLNFYDLEAPSKKLFPVITPIRNTLPRVPGRGGTATNWRAVTAINVDNIPMGVAEGVRGAVIDTTVIERTAKYMTVGLEDSVTWEADYAGRGFEDIRAMAVENLLRAVFVGEEVLYVGGNASLLFGTNPTATATPAAGGAMTAQAWNVRVVPLSLHAYMRASMTKGVPTTFVYTPSGGGQQQTVNGGAGIVSVNATGTTAAGNLSLNVTWASVPGAAAYAVFAGSDADVNCRLAAIVTGNVARLTVNPPVISPPQGYASVVGTTNFNVDRSANNLVFDGYLSTIFAPGSGATIITMPTGAAGVGTGLTADTSAGIVEFDTLLKAMWDNYKLSPSEILVNSTEVKNIAKKVLNNGGSPLIRFVMDQPAGSPNALTVAAGAVVGTYLNKFSMSGGNLLPIKLHPNVPAGTILFLTHQLPYPMNNVPNVTQIRTRRDYYQLEWPMLTRKYEYGVYVDEVMQCYAPFALGAITNVGDA